ncbi:MAG: CHASE2 domain-containing protein, partial [Cyanobacteria bacterium P01_D01_bin.2]
ILLDYRHTIPSVHLRDILTVDPVRLNEWVNNRVVFFGGDNGEGDRQPGTDQRSAPQELPGVFVQAHMVNHVLDSVVDRHPSPGGWPQPVEFLWIAVWSLVAGVTCHFLQNRFWQLGGLVFLFGLLYGVSWYMAVYHSQWVPMVPAGIAIVIFGVIAGGGRRV